MDQWTEETVPVGKDNDILFFAALLTHPIKIWSTSNITDRSEEGLS